VEDILPIRIRGVIKIVSLVLVFLPCVLSAQDVVLRGRVVDPQRNALPNATVQIADRNQVVGPFTPRAPTALLPPLPPRLLPGGANQFPGGSCTRCSPAPFTAHCFAN
jgi:hypothetical protein